MNWFWKKKEAPQIPPKPPDQVEYLFAFVCDKDPRHRFFSDKRFVSQVFGQKRLCTDCGGLCFPAVYRKKQEAWWTPQDFWSFDRCICDWNITVNPIKPRFEFVRYLDNEDTRLSDETISALKERAARDLTRVVPPEEIGTYSIGLQDGETMAAQYVLGTIQEESK